MTDQSKRIAAVQTPIIPVVAELIRAAPGTISLGQGIVHYGPPPSAFSAIEEFTANPNNHTYQDVLGLPTLIETIARKLHHENRLDLDDTAIIVTAGSNMGFLNAVLAIADPGDEIVLLRPYYFNQEMAIAMCGCVPVLVDTDDNNQIDVAAVTAALSRRTRAVVTISPNNPTGAVYSREALNAINRLCEAHGIFHISDEAYEYFVYDDVEHYSPGSLTGSAAHTITTYSLSKAYGFASWRIGYMVIPRKLQGAIRKIQDTNLVCPPVISQFAAAGALRAGPEYCREFLHQLHHTRRFLADELATISDIVTVPPAQGAFYFMLRIHQEGVDSFALAKRLIQDYGVAVIPGSAFGVHAPCMLRVAYGALQPESVKEGAGRLVRGLRGILRSMT